MLIPCPVRPLGERKHHAYICVALMPNYDYLRFTYDPNTCQQAAEEDILSDDLEVACQTRQATWDHHGVPPIDGSSERLVIIKG